MSETRESFVRRFGDAAAEAIELAADGHRSALLDGEKCGDDPFADAFAVCIGFDCMSRFRDDHGIQPSTDELQTWAREARVLDRKIGPVDYLAVITGSYVPWLPDDLREQLGEAVRR